MLWGRSGGESCMKKILNKNTFEAGIYMKTNKYLTKCPEKIGHLCLRFGHFRLSETNFAEIRGEFTVKRRKYRVCGLRSRRGRSERENPVRNVASVARTSGFEVRGSY
jgi:hypothetical protein